MLWICYMLVYDNNYVCKIYGYMYDPVLQKKFPCRVALPLVATSCINVSVAY